MNIRLLLLLVLGLSAALSACTLGDGPGDSLRTEREAALDEPAGVDAVNAGWKARTLWQSDATVWSLLLADLRPGAAGPEVVAIDDRGRAALLETRGTAQPPWWLAMDRTWLGAAAWGDVDPARCGYELYFAGGGGTVYQLTPLIHGGFECRAVWFIPDEIHALLIDEVVPHFAGPDLLACTLQGKIFLLTPGGDGAIWRGISLHQGPARVRNLIAYDFDPDLDGKEILYVSKAGRLAILGWRGRALEERLLFQAEQGLARIALGAASGDAPPPVYTAGDDGRVVRHQRQPSGEWQSRTIYESADELRGVAAGNFTGDPGDECVAIHGYTGEVVLLTRGEGEEDFQTATIFTSRDKGHWLLAADIDPSNDTDEILVCGYTGRVTLLTR